MKILKVPQKYLAAYKARRGVTFSIQDVPEEWQRLHGKNVFKATASISKKTKLQSFGLTSPELMGVYIGITPSGSFSVI